MQGAGAGAAAAAGLLTRLSFAATQVPPGKKLFKNVELTYFQNSNRPHAPITWRPAPPALEADSICTRLQKCALITVSAFAPTKPDRNQT